MTDVEARILRNQVEIMWTLSYLLSKTVPDLVGRGGELDRMCEDLGAASKDTHKLLEALRASYWKPYAPPD